MTVVWLGWAPAEGDQYESGGGVLGRCGWTGNLIYYVISRGSHKGEGDICPPEPRDLWVVYLFSWVLFIFLEFCTFFLEVCLFFLSFVHFSWVLFPFFLKFVPNFWKSFIPKKSRPPLSEILWPPLIPVRIMESSLDGDSIRVARRWDVILILMYSWLL